MDRSFPESILLYLHDSTILSSKMSLWEWHFLDYQRVVSSFSSEDLEKALNLLTSEETFE